MKTLNLKHYPQYVQQFREYFNAIHEISDESWGKLTDIMILRRIKKGTLLLEYMEVENAVRFLGKGIVKCQGKYKDKTYISDFRVAPIAICESTSILQLTPSNIALETLTECDFIELPQKEFSELVNNNIEISQFAMFRICSSLELLRYKLVLLRTFTAEERYKQFLKEFPSVALNCKQDDIASYLNIKAQSLSRIRKNTKWEEDESQLKALSDEISILDWEETAEN